MKTAASVLEKIDENVEPCEDFYSFACGQFLKNTPIPENKVKVNSFNVVDDIVQEQLKKIIAMPIDDSDIEPFKIVKKFYAACMDTDAIEKRGLEGINKIHESMGGWPVVQGDKWNEHSWSWQRSVMNCRKSGYSFSYIFTVYAETDLQNSSRRTFYVRKNQKC